MCFQLCGNNFGRTTGVHKFLPIQCISEVRVPYLHSSLLASLKNSACAFNVNFPEESSVITGWWRRSAVKHQWHILQDFQQSLKMRRIFCKKYKTKSSVLYWSVDVLINCCQLNYQFCKQYWWKQTLKILSYILGSFQWCVCTDEIMNTRSLTQSFKPPFLHFSLIQLFCACKMFYNEV